MSQDKWLISTVGMRANIETCRVAKLGFGLKKNRILSGSDVKKKKKKDIPR
jgi:hypothetical protein